MPADALPFPALRWMIAGEWRAHPARVFVAAVAIAVGVALGFAVHLINTSALNEFARAMRTVNGDADLTVRAATPRGYAEALYPKLARLPGIAAASPVVELDANAQGVPLTLLGIDVLRAAAVTPVLAGRHAAPDAPPFDDQALFLSDAALEATGKAPGDNITVSAAGQEVSFHIAGTLPAIADGQRIGIVDIAAAQWRFGLLGRLQRIDLAYDPGSDPAEVQRAVSALLPPDAAIATEATDARRTDSLSRAYRVNLDMLALMALVTGAFLVYSAQSLSVARRRAHFALLRVLGAQRKAVLAQVLLEGCLVGGIGALLGLALGLGLAQGALSLFGGDLGGGYFRGSRPALIFTPEAAILFFVLGLAAALLGSLLPAYEVARAEPAIAIKTQGDAADPKRWPSGLPALALLAAGSAMAFLPAVGGIALFGYGAVALLLAGGIAAMPLTARLLLLPLQRYGLGAPALDLAVKRLSGTPGQASIALCGIVASTSLMIAMATMVASFRHSVDDWLLQILPSDVYFHIEGAGGFDEAVQAKLRAVPGVGAIHFRRLLPLTLAQDRPPVLLIAQEIDPAMPARDLPLIGSARVLAPQSEPVWLSEPATWLYGAEPGDRITLPIAGGRTFTIAGVWRDYARQQGAIAMDARTYTRLTGDTLRTDGAVDLAAGADADATIAKLRAALPASLAPRVPFGKPAQIRAFSLGIFDRSFAVTYLLEAIAIMVGLAGVGATFSAQTLARTKEFGMLRHIGVLRRQIITMLVVEGALLGAVGIAAGLALGLAIAQVLIHVVNPQSFHWTMETRLPLLLFAGVAAALVLAAAATALIAGRRALSFDAVMAVREDW